jgi:hypothetical protein
VAAVRLDFEADDVLKDEAVAKRIAISASSLADGT